LFARVFLVRWYGKMLVGGFVKKCTEVHCPKSCGSEGTSKRRHQADADIPSEEPFVIAARRTNSAI
jgi:hypothetical protein